MIIAAIIISAVRYYSSKPYKQLNICYLIEEVNFFEKQNRKSYITEIDAAFQDLLKPSFFLFDFKKGYCIPNYFIIKEYNFNNNSIKLTLKKNIVTNKNVSARDLINYFTEMGAAQVVCKLNDNNEFSISMNISGDIKKFMVKLWINRLTKKNRNDKYEGLFDFNYKKFNNKIELNIEAGFRNFITLNLFFYKDKFTMYRDYIQYNYDIAFNFNSEDIKNLGNIIEFNVIEQSKYNYLLFLNTKRLDYNERIYLFDITSESIKQLGNNSFTNSNSIYTNDLVFSAPGRIKKKYNAGVYNQKQCILLANFLARYLSLSNIELNLEIISQTSFSEYIQKNNYDLFVSQFIDIYDKERIDFIWGYESLNKVNYSNYVPDLIASGKIKSLNLEECKTQLTDELFKNKICLKLSDYINPAILSKRFNKKQVEDYKKMGIIYSLME